MANAHNNNKITQTTTVVTATADTCDVPFVDEVKVAAVRRVMKPETVFASMVSNRGPFTGGRVGRSRRLERSAVVFEGSVLRNLAVGARPCIVIILRISTSKKISRRRVCITRAARSFVDGHHHAAA